MNKISINTFAQWTEDTTIVGVITYPLQLLVEVTNNTMENFYIKKICISVKNLILSEDALEQNKTYKILPNSKFEFTLDIRHILNSYKSNKKFTVKITSNDNEVFESEQISVDILNKCKKSIKGI